MKSIISLFLSTLYLLNIKGNDKICYVKIGLADCSNCYYALNLIENIDKIFILKSEHKDLIFDIFKQKVGKDTNNLKILASDSIYYFISKDEFSTISVLDDNNIIFNSQLLNFPNRYKEFLDKYSDSSHSHKNSESIRFFNNIQNEQKLKNHPNSNKIDLSKYYHSECKVNLLHNKNIVIIDPLKNQFKKLNDTGKLILQINIEDLTQKIFENTFDSILSELKEIKLFYHHNKINKYITNISNFDVYKNNSFILLNSSLIKIINSDTFLTGFYTIIKIDENNLISIIPVESEINDNRYFIDGNLFYIKNNDTILMSIVIPNNKEKPYLYSTFKIKNKKFIFNSFSLDTIPDNLTNNRNLNYRITSFKLSENYIAFQIQMKVFKNNLEVIELKKYNFTNINDLFSSKDGINDIYRKGNFLFISYSNDSSYIISMYSCSTNKIISDDIAEVYIKKTKNYFQFDKNGNYFFINSKNQLIINEL